MMDRGIVDVFECKDRICVIVKVDLGGGIMPPWHNGYVQVAFQNIGADYDGFTLCEQLTFSGNIKREHPEIPEGTYFFGFDSAHSWDTEETCSFDAVRERAVRLAYEMALKGI